MRRRAVSPGVRRRVGKPPDFRGLANQVLRYAGTDVPLVDFLRGITQMLLDFSGCGAVELRVEKEDTCYRCEGWPAGPFTVAMTRRKPEEGSMLLACARDPGRLGDICRAVVERRCGPERSFTAYGSFWTGDAKRALPREAGANGTAPARSRGEQPAYPSVAVVPLVAADETIGLVLLKSQKRDYFSEDEVRSYEAVAPTLGLALLSRLAHTALQERVKELTCLYHLVQLAERPGITLGEILQGIAELLPPAWQYPEITSARIVLDDRPYATPRFTDGVHKQSADIVVKGRRRGAVEVTYAAERPDLDEGPFLSEERSLIDTVAQQVAALIERRQADEDKAHLQDQLRHADRLATIGQLAAGVAHELNEPLGTILGFAQLIQKQPGLPEAVAPDLEKIVITCLHAREIIRKLMLFARQMPPQKTRVDLNAVIEEALYLLESRCSGGGIALVRRLSARLPAITADRSQLHQVLVNLAVNAIQAMPGGGTLTVGTRASGRHVLLGVEDNGIGMSKEALNKIFIPFYTTKDINEGTGLGLPVVHGIVTSHGGTIDVTSAPGVGTRFEIRLPAAAPPAREERDPHGRRK
ncbi:MAG TPA: ATP-binding protein [Phycisphaerae bacterium]|nr:ATP-binding protein [Phycisphaerae bacterium]